MLHPSDNFAKPAPSNVLDRKRETKIQLPLSIAICACRKASALMGAVRK
jgi:hypothetical protein